MDPWTLGLVAVIVLGLALILYGALSDRRRNQRARAEMLSPPKRDIPRFRPEQAPPRYLSELQARRAPADAVGTDLDDSARAAIQTRLSAASTVRVAAGYAARSFVTDRASGWAVLDDPVVLVCSAPISSIRELLPLLERSAVSQHALVVAAPQFAPDVLATLEVNVIQRKLRLLALCGDKHTLATIAAHTGARPIELSDLQAGYLPVDQLGRCERWVAERKQSWILPEAAAA